MTLPPAAVVPRWTGVILRWCNSVPSDVQPTSRGSSCCAVELTTHPIRSCLVFQRQPGHHLRSRELSGKSRTVQVDCQERIDLPDLHGEFTQSAPKAIIRTISDFSTCNTLVLSSGTSW